MSDFLTQLALRARRAEAARAAKLAQLGDDIARTGQARRGLYGRVLAADGGLYPQYLSQFDELAERMAALERRRDALADDTPYLARMRRAYKSPGEPDMSLDSDLFRDMYQADQAFEQLRSGRAANLRNAGGELASIAGQAIRDADDAARAARSMSPLESALQVGPDGMVALGVLGGGLAAGAGGMVVNNALQERRRRQAEVTPEVPEHIRLQRRAAEAAAAQQFLNDIDGFDPVATDVYVDPQYEREMLESIVASSRPDFAEDDEALEAAKEAALKAIEAEENPFPGMVYEEPVLRHRRRSLPAYSAPEF
jgi:hypothetical protein